MKEISKNIDFEIRNTTTQLTRIKKYAEIIVKKADKKGGAK